MNDDISIDAVCSPPIAALARLGTVQRFARKTLLLKEGDTGRSMYILLAGRVRIFIDNQNERRFVIGSYGPGTLFGEVALDGGPRTASVETLADSVCAVVQYADLRDHIEDNPQFAMALVTELIARSRATTQRMKGLALSSVYQRLLTLVANEATTEGDHRILGPDWTQQEIADRLGSSRDMVTKIFRELHKGGYIETGRGETRILKPLPKAW